MKGSVSEQQYISKTKKEIWHSHPIRYSTRLHHTILLPLLLKRYVIFFYLLLCWYNSYVKKCWSVTQRWVKGIDNVKMKKIHGLTLTGVNSKIKMFCKQRWPSSLQQNYELSMFSQVLQLGRWKSSGYGWWWCLYNANVFNAPELYS